MNDIFRKEQQKIDNDIHNIKLNEQKTFSNFELGKKHFYDVSIDYSDQKRYQNLYDTSKTYLEKRIYPLIDSPYFGKIEGFGEDGLPITAYVGYQGYEAKDVKIHDFRSTEGQIFRSKKNFYLGHNVTLNRVLQIKKSQLQKYIDSPLDQTEESQIFKQPDMQAILKFNKENKRILTTLTQAQNGIIDYPKEQNLVLQGVPGSGKTALGGYRLSNLVFQYDAVAKGKHRMIYLTANEEMKHYSVSLFSSIDLDRIDFLTCEEIHGFSSIEEHFDETKKSVYFGRHKVKGKLLKPLNEYPPMGLVEIELSDKKIIRRRRSDVHLYKNTWAPLVKKVFSSNLAESVREFMQFKRTKKVFEVLNKAKNEFWILEVGQQIFNANLSTSHKNELIQEYMEHNLSYAEVRYLIRFSMIYYMFSKNIDIKIDTDVKSIYVDEAQDYPLLELKLIQFMYPNASFILSGDVNQSSGLGSTQDNWNGLVEAFDAKLMVLNTCFRSSNKIVNEINRRMPIKIYGEAVSVDDVSGTFKSFDTLNDLVKETNILEEETCFIYINEQTREKLDDFNNKNNITLRHAYEVKGLEFKNVVLFDINEIKTHSDDKKFIYMLISRALENVYYLNRNIY